MCGLPQALAAVEGGGDGREGVPEPLICGDPVPWQTVSWPPQVSALPASSEAHLPAAGGVWRSWWGPLLPFRGVRVCFGS